AGKGNNGGDGLVVARLLHNRGGKPVVFLLAAKEEVRGDAALNLRIAEAVGVEVRKIRTPADWKKQRRVLREATVIVDAIFGTGLIKPAEGIQALAIQDINKCTAFKLAVDIPSGLSSDSAEIIGPAVRADLTVTLAAPKIAHVFPPAEEYVGDFLVADISIPPRLFAAENLKLEMTDRESLLPLFRRRRRDSHKGSYGHLLMIAGSLGKTGAAVMAARAAYRMGAGLVTVGTPRTCLPIIARSMLELMTEPLAETGAKTISAEALPRVRALLAEKDAMLLGPGLSTEESTRQFVWQLIPHVKKPLVVDADGLNILALKRELLARLPRPSILTPHPGEFARLTGLSIPEVIKNKLELVPAFAREHGVYLVLKGYRTLVAAPDGRVFVNPTGNPGLATGGTGDVLSGMVGALLMQQKDPLQAAVAAVYLHGLSGDLAAQKTGERGLVAGDLIRFLPQAVRSLEEGAEAAGA
ncbi:MAG: NAD(P)H-hydrate dehydratase, partial [Candidatus Aminicenantes bacterium]|nr:NAD(P)H-hydrate dehydratase [Candidatus Aminicenantes bacterium]